MPPFPVFSFKNFVVNTHILILDIIRSIKNKNVYFCESDKLKEKKKQNFTINEMTFYQAKCQKGCAAEMESGDESRR